MTRRASFAILLTLLSSTFAMLACSTLSSGTGPTGPTSVPSTASAAQPTATARPTQTPLPVPTETSVPPTATDQPTATEIPPTPKPTRTPRPAATATPGPGDLVLAADFTDLTDWSQVGFSFKTWKETANYTFETRHGNLYVEVPEKNTSIYGFYPVDLPGADAQIDVDVETVAGPNRNNVSVVCRMNKKGWYEMSIHSGGLWVIYRFDTDNGFTELGSGGSTSINMQKDVNHLTAVCAGSTLAFYVNGVELKTVKDSTFDSGDIGLSASSFDIGGVGIEFSNLEVRVPIP